MLSLCNIVNIVIAGAVTMNSQCNVMTTQIRVLLCKQYVDLQAAIA